MVLPYERIFTLMTTNTTYHIAIIGAGPRGLSGLEQLCLQYSGLNTTQTSYLGPDHVHLTLFNDKETLGPGTPWEIDQTPHNWLNISDRALENLEGRVAMHWRDLHIPSFPSYIDWCDKHDYRTYTNARDYFPSRSQMGQYLKARFKSIALPLKDYGVLKVITQKVIEVKTERNFLSIKTTSGQIDTLFHESVLTIGHQPTTDSPQIKKWKAHSKTTAAILIDNCYRKDLRSTIGSAIGIRGMGLAMIDVVRLLAHTNHNYFTSASPVGPFLKYHIKNRSFEHIVLFSLDGFPPAPKPVGKRIDRKFAPSKKQRKAFKKEIKSHLDYASGQHSPNFLVEAFAKIAAAIYQSLSNEVGYTFDQETQLQEVIKDQVNNKNFKHEACINRSLPKIDYLKRLCLMAFGKAPFSLDYVVGQVWRHLQPDMYRLFAHTGLPDATMDKIVAIDEGTKAYSYGPPVKSVLQLIAMMESGILRLDVSSNPDIKTIPQGWQLSNSTTTYKVDTMINTVLDKPKLEAITAPILTNLLKDDVICPVSSDLGVATKANALIESKDASFTAGLAMLGRNCKGSVLGVDAILECFSPEITHWATGVLTRHLAYIDS